MNETPGFKLSDEDAKELSIVAVGVVLGIIGLILNGQKVRELVAKGLANGHS